MSYRLTWLGGLFDPQATKKRFEELEKLTLKPDFWDDQQAASTVLKEKSILEKQLASFDYVNDGLAEALELAEIAEEENDSESKDKPSVSSQAKQPWPQLVHPGAQL